MQKSPDWYFLRGLSRSELHWGQFKPKFEKAFQTQVTCLELPGNGHRFGEKTPLSMEELISDLRKKKLKTHPEPVWALGISLGGMTLFQWASQYPEDFKGVVLLNISLPKINRIWDRIRWAKALTWLSLAFPVSPEKKEGIIFDLTSQNREEKNQIVPQWVEIEKKYPISKRNILAQIGVARSLKIPAHKPQVPILILNSLGDELVAPRCSLQIASHYQIPIERHPSAGHDLPLDAPEWVIEKTKNWFTSLL